MLTAVYKGDSSQDLFSEIRAKSYIYKGVSLSPQLSHFFPSWPLGMRSEIQKLISELKKWWNPSMLKCWDDIYDQYEFLKDFVMKVSGMHPTQTNCKSWIELVSFARFKRFLSKPKSGGLLMFQNWKDTEISISLKVCHGKGALGRRRREKRRCNFVNKCSSF